MNPTPQTHLVVAGPSDGWKYVPIEMLLRMIRNIDSEKIAKDLVERVFSKQMSYFDFREEQEAVSLFCRVLFPSNNPGIIEGNKLHLKLSEGYLLADVELNKLGLAKL